MSITEVLLKVEASDYELETYRTLESDMSFDLMVLEALKICGRKL